MRRKKIGFIRQGVQILHQLNALNKVIFPKMRRGMGDEERRRMELVAPDKVRLKRCAAHCPLQAKRWAAGSDYFAASVAAF